MAFYLVREQSRGCDYTIHCGLDLKKITVSRYDSSDPATMEEAERIVVTDDRYLGNFEEFEDDDEWYESGYLTPNCDPEQKLQSARILEVTVEKAIDFDHYIALSKARIDAFNKKAEEKAEREEYERLKAKFGK